MGKWLKLDIKINIVHDTIFFHLIFCNNSLEPQSFKFSNLNYGLERVGLIIMDEQRLTLSYKRYQTINQPYKTDDNIEILPNDSWEFVIKGIFENKKLRFHAIEYDIEAGKKYYAKFKYLDHIAKSQEFIFE